MGTTNLFVELLVIGIGCAGWLTLLAFAALGYDSVLVKGLLSTPAAAVPALALIYLLGIVVDRLADASLQHVRVQRRCLKYYLTENECYQQRGRQRICRGWILNAPLLAISLNVFLIARPAVIAHPIRASGFVTPTLLLLGAACWFAWEKLADTELKRIRDQAGWLRALDNQPPGSAVSRSTEDD